MSSGLQELKNRGKSLLVELANGRYRDHEPTLLSFNGSQAKNKNTAVTHPE